MKFSKLIFLYSLINLILIIYLTLPLPTIPTLPNSITSQEAGDTIQMKNVRAFYTNDYRAKVMNFFNNYFSKPYIKINHPPEKAKQIYRDTIQSYYLEEFVFPLKGSIFVNGYEWEHDVFTKPDKRIVNKMIINGQDMNSKVTLRWFYPSLLARYLNLVFINLFLIFFYLTIIKKENKS